MLRAMMVQRRFSVLLVEDDAVTRAFLAEALADSRCSVAACSDAQAALALAQSATPDLLLTDLGLPDHDGRWLLQSLRRRGVACPAIALSAELDAGTRRELRQVGFADALVKPVALPALFAAIELALAALPAPSGVNEAATPVQRDAAAAPPDFDDDAALRTTGAREIYLALRELQRTELPQQWVSLRDALAHDDRKSASHVLHRMRGACGLCGTPALEAAIDRLQSQFRAPAQDAAAQALATVNATAELQGCIDRILDAETSPDP